MNAALKGTSAKASNVLQKETTLLRLNKVMERTGLCRSAVYGKGFPKPIKLGGGRTAAWISTEVDAWVASQILAARGGPESEGSHAHG